MKKRSKNILRFFCQLSSLLLVLLFFSISVTQAFHSHKKQLKLEQSLTDDDSVEDSDNCSICYYFNQKQPDQQFTHYPPVMVLPIPEAVNYNTKNFIGNYKFTLQGFTNKGPPPTIIS